MGRLKTIRTGKGIDRRHQEGQVTIFLTLLLVVLLPILFLTLEVIRYEQAKGRISHIMVGAVEQVMADYQVEMEQWYHIYTLDENYLGKGKEVASNRVWDYLEENLLSVDWLGRVKGFYNFQVKDAQMIPKQYLYENQCEHLKSQIHGWAIHTMLPNQKRRTRTNENARNQKSRSVSNPVERKEQENRSNEKESQAIIDMLDPRNLIEEIKRLGILTVASNDRLPLSKVKILGEDLPSKQLVWAKADGATNSSIIQDKAELELYIWQHFQSALSIVREEETAYSNEIEYLISGKQSDYDCLEKVAKELVLLRLPINVVAIHKDSGKKNEARATALLIATLLLQPEAVEAIQEGILDAWAYGESIADVKCLLEGEKVPIKKNSSNWKLSFSQLFHMNTMVPKQSESGMEYEEYLKLLLLKVPEKKLYFRMLDLMQLNIQIKYPEFQIKDCMTQYQIDTTVQLDTRFFSLPMKKGSGYEFIMSRTGSYQ